MNLDTLRRNCALSPRSSASQTQSVVKVIGGLGTVVDWETLFSKFFLQMLIFLESLSQSLFEVVSNSFWVGPPDISILFIFFRSSLS